MARSHFFGIVVAMGMQVGAAGAVIFDSDGGSVGDFHGHFRFEQRVSAELTLKSGRVKSVAAPGSIQQLQMNVEKRGVNGERYDDEAQHAGHEMFDDVEDWQRPVAQQVPQLFSRTRAHEQDDEEADELGGNGASEEYAA